MEQKSEHVQVKSSHLSILLFVFGLVVGAFAGYYFGIQQSFGTTSTGIQTSFTGDGSEGSSQGITVTRDALFTKYATDLKLNKQQFESCVDDGEYTEDVNSDYKLALALGATGTPTFVINGQLVPIGAAPYEEFKSILDKELATPSNRSMALSLVNSKDQTLGKKDAPIIMLEFSDFQCPFCGKFWKDTLPQIKKDYVDIGKVLFVYKDFPLRSIHPLAQKAAETALCAGEQGKYWEYHDTLFAKQIEWAR